MHSAYKRDKSLSWVEDPQDILTFLDHHFDLTTSGENQDESYTSNPVTIEALKDSGPTNSSFVRGICYAFQDDRPFQLRKAALFFSLVTSCSMLIRSWSQTE